MLAPVALGVLDQAVEPRQFLAHRADLLADRALGAAQLLGAPAPLGGQHLVLHAHQLFDRQFLRDRRRRRRPARGAHVGARHEDEHREEPDHDDRKQRNHEFHP